nr:MAG TPA: hypothetical protein [Caudoviricetes sp.]
MFKLQFLWTKDSQLIPTLSPALNVERGLRWRSKIWKVCKI